MRKLFLLFCLCAIAEVSVAATSPLAKWSGKRPTVHRPNYTVYKPHAYRHGLARLLHFGKH